MLSLEIKSLLVTQFIVNWANRRPSIMLQQYTTGFTNKIYLFIDWLVDLFIDWFSYLFTCYHIMHLKLQTCVWFPMVNIIVVTQFQIRNSLVLHGLAINAKSRKFCLSQISCYIIWNINWVYQFMILFTKNIDSHLFRSTIYLYFSLLSFKGKVNVW